MSTHNRPIVTTQNTLQSTNVMTSKNWTFTLNNPEDAQAPAGWPVKYVAWQLEKGEEGTPHLQGYVELHKTARITGLKKINGQAHWEIRMGTQEQAIAYVEKEDTRVEGPWSNGEKAPGRGTRTDLAVACDVAMNEGIEALKAQHPTEYVKYHKGIEKLAEGERIKRIKVMQKEKFSGKALRPWQASLHNKLQVPAGDRKIHWYYENGGNVGKTWFSKYLKATEGATVLDCSKKADLAYMLRGHTGKVIIFNIVRSMDEAYMGHVYGLCEAIKDDCVVSTKYEPCDVPLGDQHVLVFANIKPDMTKWSEDRYDVVEIEPDQHNGIGGVSFKGGQMGPVNPFALQSKDGPSKKRKREEESQFYGYGPV